MPRRATESEIIAAGEMDLEDPGLVSKDGEPMSIRVRKVDAGERESLMPPVPAHIYDELPEDDEKRQKALIERRQAWLAGLSKEEIEARTEEAGRFHYRLVARAAVDPILTEHAASRLGDAAVRLSTKITAFSRNELARGGGEAPTPPGP
jgi:hypothetical protein